MKIEPAVYNDDFANEVREQLLKVDGVLVWVNPITEDGRDRTQLDAMLQEISDAGVFVSAHPNSIRKMGTKEVLYRTREMSWGSDVRVYRSLAELQTQLPLQLKEGKPRVLKFNRGHSGNGVWKVSPHPQESSMVIARHAARGSVEQAVPLQEFLATFEGYFDGRSLMVDQAYQERLSDGMIRCYLVQDRVEGFGHQEINALFPAPPGAPSEEAPQPGQRLYYPPSQPEFQRLKEKMETEWMGELLKKLSLEIEELPLLWDADFFLGPKDVSGNNTHILCEINVSSVYPYPESALQPLTIATRAQISG